MKPLVSREPPRSSSHLREAGGDVLVVLEQCFWGREDGSIWTDSPFVPSFWQRYLEVFDRVTVLARVQPATRVPAAAVRVDDRRVRFVAIPWYKGPWQYARRAMEVRRVVRSSLAGDAAVILRAPSQLAAIAAPHLQRQGRPYGVEVVGDPYDVFAPGVVRHPLRPLFRWIFPRRLRAQCARACAAAYVTEATLQRRYPTAPGVYSTSYSSIELPEAALVRAPRRFDQAATRLITIASLDQLYKGTDLLIDALARCRASGLGLQLTVLGEGRYRGHLEGRSAALGLAEAVRFCGQVASGAAVFEELDRAELFVLPSRTEGLPRAMIEAMARALPCLGTSVGGIPELLPAEDMVAAENVEQLVTRIREVCGDLRRLERMSERNLDRARGFRADVLRERRTAFYRYVRERTHAWRRVRVKSR